MGFEKLTGIRQSYPDSRRPLLLPTSRVFFPSDLSIPEKPRINKIGDQGPLWMKCLFFLFNYFAETIQRGFVLSKSISYVLASDTVKSSYNAGSSIVSGASSLKFPCISHGERLSVEELFVLAIAFLRTDFQPLGNNEPSVMLKCMIQV